MIQLNYFKSSIAQYGYIEFVHTNNVKDLYLAMFVCLAGYFKLENRRDLVIYDRRDAKQLWIHDFFHDFIGIKSFCYMNANAVARATDFFLDFF